MECPDCKNKVLSFHEYCQKCGAALYRSDETHPINKNEEHAIPKSSLTVD